MSLAALPRCQQFGRPVRRRCAEQARIVVAQRDDAGAGQGGDVDDRGRVEALGVGQRVAQHQAAFGVGVEHFDGLAVHGGDDVARAWWRVPVGMFSQLAMTPMTLSFRFISRDGAQGAQHRGGAAHVVLHLVHARPA